MKTKGSLAAIGVALCIGALAACDSTQDLGGNGEGGGAGTGGAGPSGDATTAGPGSGPTSASTSTSTSTGTGTGTTASTGEGATTAQSGSEASSGTGTTSTGDGGGQSTGQSTGETTGQGTGETTGQGTGQGGGASCNELDEQGTSFSFSATPPPAPAPDGGVIADGVYVIDAEVAYTSSNQQPAEVPGAWTLEVSGNTMNRVVAGARQTFEITLEDTAITRLTTCDDQTPEAVGTSFTVGYTATDETFTEFLEWDFGQGLEADVYTWRRIE